MYVSCVLEQIFSFLQASERPFEVGALREFKRWLQHLDGELAADEHVVRALALLQDVP